MASLFKYVPYAVQAVFVLGGLALGLWLKSGAVAPASEGAHAANTVVASHQSAAADAHGGTTAAENKAKNKKEKNKDAHGAKKSSHGSNKDSHGGKSGGHDSGGDSDAGYGFLKFSRQFVVPVVDHTGVRSLVVMDINIEVPPSIAGSAYTLEPKLRDAVLAALLDLSNRGAFNENLLDQANQDAIRQDVLVAARRILGEDALNVLILSMARQDV